MSLVPCGPHRFELFYSRFHSQFAPGFAPGPIGLPPSHSISVSTDRPFKTTTLQESITRNFIYALRAVCET
jgi:hypothetical protein